MKQLNLKSDRTKSEYFKKQIIFLSTVENAQIGKACQDIRVLFKDLICNELPTTEQLRTSGNEKTTSSSK